MFIMYNTIFNLVSEQIVVIIKIISHVHFVCLVVGLCPQIQTNDFNLVVEAPLSNAWHKGVAISMRKLVDLSAE